MYTIYCLLTALAVMYYLRGATSYLYIFHVFNLVTVKVQHGSGNVVLCGNRVEWTECFGVNK